MNRGRVREAGSTTAVPNTVGIRVMNVEDQPVRRRASVSWGCDVARALPTGFMWLVWIFELFHGEGMY